MPWRGSSGRAPQRSDRGSSSHASVMSKGFGLNCAQISHCFARVYATTPHLSSAKACTIAMESDTSAHVLRFTGFGHMRERRRLEDAFLTNAAATVRSVGAS